MTRKLRWQDIAQMFSCGRSKALLIVHQMRATYVGRTPFVDEDELEAFIREHGEIKLAWPKRI
ncbi:hypothetical protein [Gordonibacter sp. An230]|uniref:hypothetical protein n=1 Tax=Gordonibacter sp. An230 TaxID=1965592 RepID=UPI0011234065|nr:hypothetical protein [Gordonibacter sp. An230]